MNNIRSMQDQEERPAIGEGHQKPSVSRIIGLTPPRRRTITIPFLRLQELNRDFVFIDDTASGATETSDNFHLEALLLMIPETTSLPTITLHSTNLAALVIL